MNSVAPRDFGSSTLFRVLAIGLPVGMGFVVVLNGWVDEVIAVAVLALLMSLMVALVAFLLRTFHEFRHRDAIQDDGGDASPRGNRSASQQRTQRHA